jgi:uncharacterized protein (DUF362 family)
MRIGDVFFAKVKSFEEFKDFIKSLDIKADTFVIKPNWVEPSKGQYTEVLPLQWLFDCLDGKKIIIESHTAWRNKLLLETGEVVVNADNVDQKRDFLRENDKWFLESTGLKQLLEKYDVEYVNITEEVWKGEVVDAEIIRGIVEEKFPAVQHKELYSVIPKKIFGLKNVVLIDLAKIKTDGGVVMSLSTKNLFGLIPDPKRSPKYHDHEKKILPYAILDINKIYRALFKTIFINEGIFTAADGPSPEQGRLKENLNLIVAGHNSIDVDLTTAKLVGINPEELLNNLLQPVNEVFGSNPEILANVPENFADKLNYKE